MRFLVFGCKGMAGHMISLYLKEQEHDVLGFARSKSNLVETIVGNALDKEYIRSILYEGVQIDYVINCIGILNQNAENQKADAVYLNSYFPHYLTQLTEGTKTQVIQISTDCVFSGNRGQYTENDFRDGVTFYGRSKALGEIEDGKNLTLRNSIVGPDINPEGIGLLNWFMQQNREVNGYVDVVWTGQTTLQLAKTIEAVAKEKAYGLINAVPNDSISKYDLLQLFNKYLRNNAIKINPVSYKAADKSLKRTRFNFDYQIPDYEQMISELADWMRKYRKLYPHYNL